MTNMQPIPQAPGNNDDSAVSGVDDGDGPLDPDLDENQVDSAAADAQAASEGTLPSS